MLKAVAAGLTALFVAASSLTYAQPRSIGGSEQKEPRLSATARQTRLAALARQREQDDSDPVDIARQRADALAQRTPCQSD